jgi:hypothetical protein
MARFCGCEKIDGFSVESKKALLSMWKTDLARAHWMAADSSDGAALSPLVTSFKLCGKICKIGNAIHTTGTRVIDKKKMVQLWAIVSQPQGSKTLI